MKKLLTSMTLAFGIIVMTSLCYASQGASLLNGLNKPNDAPNDAPIQVADPAAGAGKLLAYQHVPQTKSVLLARTGYPRPGNPGMPPKRGKTKQVTRDNVGELWA